MAEELVAADVRRSAAEPLLSSCVAQSTIDYDYEILHIASEDRRKFKLNQPQ
jgi:hypothetical protein